MTIFVLHSEHDKASREFVESLKGLEGYVVVDWEKEGKVFLKEHPTASPSSFPALVYELPETGGLDATLYVINAPTSVEEAEQKKEEAFIEKEKDGAALPPKADLKGFVAEVLSSPLIVPVFNKAANALDLLVRYINTDNKAFLGVYWESLKVELDKEVVEFIESTSLKHNININD